jgi:hypothetical protein
MPEVKEALEKLATEINGIDARLREFMAAEKPEEGIVHAGDIHRLRQEKLQKRLEMDYCRAKMRFLQHDGAGILQ